MPRRNSSGTIVSPLDSIKVTELSCRFTWPTVLAVQFRSRRPARSWPLISWSCKATQSMACFA
eukprot:576275-Amphidinium_carterae.1